MSSLLCTGTLHGFFEQWKCTPNERNLIVIYLAVIRLKKQLNDLSHYITNMNLIDGDGI